MSTDLKISQLTPATTVNTNDFTVMVDGNTSANKRATVAQILAIAGAGTVTSINVSGANGINSSGGPISSSGTIALSLGAITPTSIVASGTISGSNLSNTNTGDQAITIVGDVTAPASTGTLTTTLANSVVTNDKLADMVGPTVKGRTSGTGIPQDLSTAQITAMLPEMVADSGTGGTKGLVPPPTAGSAAAKKFLRADATWVATDLNDILPTQSGNIGKVLQTNGTTTSWQAVGVGSVTNVSVTTANGVSGTVANSSTVPAISLTLGAITPTSVNSVVMSGSSTPTLAVTGTSSISNANTGDQTTITGNAGSATILQTARAINGVNFDGSAAITVTAAGSTLSDTVPIAKGGTGQITAQAALNALLPSQTGASGKNLQSDGTNVSFVADAGGTVTSVAATAGTGISVSGSPITTSGTLTITNTAPDQTVAIAAGTGISVSGTYPSFTVTNSSPSSGGTVTSVAATVPSVFSISGSPITGAGTLAMTYSGTALPVANGGTGVTTSTGTTNVVLSGSPTITTPVIAQINDANGNATVKLTGITSATDYLEIKNAIGVGSPLHIIAEGASASIGLHLQPKGTGLLTISDGVDFNKGIRFRSSSSATSAVTLIDAVSTAGRVITLPDATDTLVGRATTDTLTNKTITGGILNGTLGATTPSTVAGTTGTFSGKIIVGGVSGADATANAEIYGSVSAALFPTLFVNGAATNTSNEVGLTFQALTTTSQSSIARIQCNFTNNTHATRTGQLNFYVANSGAPSLVGSFTSTGLNSTAIGATTPSTGAFTTISSTVAGGQARTLASSTATGVYERVVVNSVTKGYWGTADQTVGGASVNDLGITAINNLLLNSGSGMITVGGGGAAITGTLSATGLTTLDLGTGTLPALINGSQSLRLSQANDVSTGMQADTFGSATGFQLYARQASGTRAAPSATSSGRAILDILAYGYTDALRTAPNARYQIIAKSLWSATNAETQHIWYSTPSASLTNAVVMTLDSTGLEITGKLSSTAASNIFTFVNSTAGSATNKISFGVTTNEYSFINYSDTTGYLSIGQPSGRSYGVNIQTNGANVGVFTAAGLAVTGAISSTGNTTLASSSNKVFMCGSTASVSVERALMQFDGSGAYGFGIKCTSATGSHMRFYNSSGTDNGYIYSTNSTTMVYGSASDGRLKTNIRPLNDSGSIIDAIQPHIFDWKHGETLNCHGFIAQELNEVFPEAVVAGDDDEDVIKSTWGIDPAKLVPVLVAELQSLRKRLATLESK